MWWACLVMEWRNLGILQCTCVLWKTKLSCLHTSLVSVPIKAFIRASIVTWFDLVLSGKCFIFKNILYKCFQSTLFLFQFSTNQLLGPLQKTYWFIAYLLNKTKQNRTYIYFRLIINISLSTGKLIITNKILKMQLIDSNKFKSIFSAGNFCLILKLLAR